MTKYELLITAEYRSACKSKYEALFLCAIAGVESSVIKNATDKDLSDRVIGLVPSHQVGKYLGMLIKKGIITVCLKATGVESYRLFVEEMSPDDLTIQGAKFSYPHGKDSALRGIKLNIAGDICEVSDRTITIDRQKLALLLSRKSRQTALDKFIDEAMPKSAFYQQKKQQQFHSGRIPLGVFYMIQADDLIKIGFSSQVRERIKSYCHQHSDIKILFIGTRLIPIGIEKQFHNKNNFGSEWYLPQREYELLCSLKAIDREAV